MNYEPYEPVQYEFADSDDQPTEEHLIRHLEVGEKFLMRKTNLSNTSPEMEELRGQWLTVTRIKKVKQYEERIYAVAECHECWNWHEYQHMDIHETNKRIQLVDGISKIDRPNLPLI